MQNVTAPSNNAPVSGQPRRTNPYVVGLVMIAAGLLLFAQNLGWLDRVQGFIWGIAFAVGGLAFLYAFLTDITERWWAAIPAFALFGLSGSILLDQYASGRMSDLAGGVFLGSIGLGFLIIAMTRRDAWWALIPGGTLVTLGVVASLDEMSLAPGMDTGGVLFVGLGVTFLLVALTGMGDDHKRWWAFIPAAVLFIMGTLILADAAEYLAMLNYLWPVALIVVGGWMLYKAINRRNA